MEACYDLAVKAAAWLFCAGALSAQTVTVTGSVTNAITGEPIASVSVVLSTTGGTSGANSDPSGRFRIPNVKAGAYRLAPSRIGFDSAAREIRIEAGVDPPPFDLTMTPWPGVRGRVLDPEGQPVARARVRAMLQATGLAYEAITDSAGRYTLDHLAPGQYHFLALPPAAGSSESPMELAPTWFPSGTDRRDAALAPLATGGDVSGLDIVLRSVPVFRLSGRVVDDRGEPAAGATVTTGLSERKSIVRDDGAFTLVQVRPGEGTLRAEWRPGEAVLKGFVKLTVGSHDVEDLTVRVSPPVVISGEIELDGKAPHHCQGEAILEPVDGHGEKAQVDWTDSGVRFDRVYPGRYRLIALPGWQWGRHYLEAVRLGDRDITLDEVEVSPGMTPFRVVLRTGGGRVLGTVENGRGGRVALLPRDERLRLRPFIIVAFFQGGTFALENVRPGEYYAFPITGSVGIEDLQDPAYARAFLDGAITVRVERGHTSTLTLAY